MPDISECVGCGITAVDGRLTIAGAGAWPFDCDQAGGRNLYVACDAANNAPGRVHGEPEKFFVYDEDTLTHSAGSTQLRTFVPPDQANSGPLLTRTSTGPFTVGPATVFQVINPSPCLTMRLVVRFGVEHVQVTKIGPGSSEIVIGVMMGIDGDGEIPFSDETGSQPSGHQSWRHDTDSPDFNRIVWDTQGAYTVRRYILSPGGTATVSLIGNLDVRQNNGNTTLQAWRSRIEVFGASRSYAETLTDLATTT